MRMYSSTRLETERESEGEGDTANQLQLKGKLEGALYLHMASESRLLGDHTNMLLWSFSL